MTRALLPLTVNGFQVAIIVILALFIGMSIPLVVQLSLTIRSANKLLSKTGPKVSDTLVNVDETMKRVNRLGAELEKDKTIERSLISVGELAENLNRFSSTLRKAGAVGAALAPAVTAAIQAFRTTTSDEEAEAEEAAPLEAAAAAPADGEPSIPKKDGGAGAPRGHGSRPTAMNPSQQEVQT